jgi:hypothetical protein
MYTALRNFPKIQQAEHIPAGWLRAFEENFAAFAVVDWTRSHPKIFGNVEEFADSRLAEIFDVGAGERINAEAAMAVY